MDIEVADVAVAVEITPGATGALADTFPQILKQDVEVISVDITITIYVASDAPKRHPAGDGRPATRGGQPCRLTPTRRPA